jgi:hypothetical protein
LRQNQKRGNLEQWVREHFLRARARLRLTLHGLPRILRIPCK